MGTRYLRLAEFTAGYVGAPVIIHSRGTAAATGVARLLHLALLAVGRLGASVAAGHGVLAVVVRQRVLQGIQVVLSARTHGCVIVTDHMLMEAVPLLVQHVLQLLEDGRL